MPKIRYKSLFAIILLLSAAGFIASFFLGSSGVSFKEFAELLRGNATTAQETIFLQLRLPRALLAYTVGAALAVAGCSLQGVFKNPMADPFILGISSGAALGATIAMAAGIGITAAGIGGTNIFCVSVCADRDLCRLFFEQDPGKGFHLFPFAFGHCVKLPSLRHHLYYNADQPG